MDAEPAALTYEAPVTVRRMMLLAQTLVNVMSPTQRATAMLPLEDPGRLNWDFVPKPDRSGVPLADLDHHQRTLAHSLLACGLSPRGYSQALSVMALENALREQGKGRFGVAAGDLRDPDRYFLTIYGLPAFGDTWGWRFLGHHFSVSYTIVEQRFLTVTPCNVGAEPARWGVLDPVGEEERAGFALLDSLDAAARATAIIHDVAPADFVTRQIPRVGAVELPDPQDLGIDSYVITEQDRQALAFRADEPAGVCAADLPADTAAAIRDLAALYVGRMPAEIGNQYLAQLDRDGPESLHFAWAGATDTGGPHYYRIQGSRLLVEFDNAIDNGNHIHSVWRDYRNDLGHDLILEHYRREPHQAGPVPSRLTSSTPQPGDRNPFSR